MAIRDKNTFNLSYFLLIIILSTLSISNVKGTPQHDDGDDVDGITIDLIHRESHLSPSHNPSTSYFERLTSSINRSFSRKSLLLSKSKSNLSIQAPLTSAVGEYLMKIRIGTPPIDTLLIADTGSDLTWTQCTPCKNCFKQRSPMFDPKKSKTYKRVSCASKKCSEVGNLGCEATKRCTYKMFYGDRSHSYGDLSRETFAFGPAQMENGPEVAFPKVVFGCGHDNGGTFNESATGIAGLGGGSLSLVNQLRKFVQRRFSYCLTFLDSNVSSKISFGSKAVVEGPYKVMSTPLIPNVPNTYYYITLEGISVGGKKLTYYDRSLKESYRGNMIIDSGTTLTFLPSELYEKLESTLASVMKGKRVKDSKGLFKMCYGLPENGNEFYSPPITVHFTGADLELTRGSAFVEVELGVVCLTFMPTADLAIFGNLHQMNYLVGYDLVDKRVSFMPMDCSKV